LLLRPHCYDDSFIPHLMWMVAIIVLDPVLFAFVGWSVGRRTIVGFGATYPFLVIVSWVISPAAWAFVEWGWPMRRVLHLFVRTFSTDWTLPRILFYAGFVLLYLMFYVLGRRRNRLVPARPSSGVRPGDY